MAYPSALIHCWLMAALRTLISQIPGLLGALTKSVPAPREGPKARQTAVVDALRGGICQGQELLSQDFREGGSHVANPSPQRAGQGVET